MSSLALSSLALLGGQPAVSPSNEDVFHWPIVTEEDEAAVLDVLRRGAMSGTDVTIEFEKEFAAWQGRSYALAHNTGTAALHGAMFGCEIGVGDELIAPSITYWASVLQVFSLGATMVFAEIDPNTLCIDPNQIEQHISPHDLDALRLFRHCATLNLPVVVHLDYEFDTGRKYPRPNWWYGGGIDPFERAVRACPETIFIGHAPAFWGHISGDDRAKTEPYPKGDVLPGGKVPQMLRDYPNLHADLSAGSALTALSRDAEFAKDFMIEFQDRLLYGRDYFDNRMQDFITSLELPEEALVKIYCENALRLAPDQEPVTA